MMALGAHQKTSDSLSLKDVKADEFVAAMAKKGDYFFCSTKYPDQ